MVIFKYTLRVTDELQFLEVPKDSKLLHIDNQYETITLWIMVNPKRTSIKRAFRVIGTGHKHEDMNKWTYIGTVLIQPFVWHIFEL